MNNNEQIKWDAELISQSVPLREFCNNTQYDNWQTTKGILNDISNEIMCVTISYLDDNDNGTHTCTDPQVASDIAAAIGSGHDGSPLSSGSPGSGLIFNPGTVVSEFVDFTCQGKPWIVGGGCGICGGVHGGPGV